MSRPKDAPPGSPWLNRFEGFHEGFSRPGYFFEWDGVQHSGFAPELPKVADPKYYLEPPNRLPNSGVPSDEELDRMFRTEEHQAATLRGMTTYQINSMNRWVQFTPELPPMSGGHLQSDSTPAAQAEAARVWREYGIKVDESKWFSFFRKERWCDWTSTSPPSKKEGIKWSMDDPKLFEAFSPALELANRVLQTLVDQKHPTLGMFLYGRVDDWSNLMPDEPEPFEEPMVFVSQEMEVKLAEKYNTEVPKDEAASRDKSEWKERLEGLLEMVIWSFFDSKLIAEGLTHMTVEHCIPAIITMDINRLPPLMDPTITIAERVRLLFKVSCTIVHELTHALVACRLNNYVPGSFEDHKNNGRAVRTHDIIVDFQGVAEAGLHVENAYYGGIHHFTLAGLPITSITHEAPSGMLKRLYAFVPGPWSEDGASFKSTYVQSSYASRLLSEAWWQDPDLPVRSLDYFHKPYTFTSEARTGELRWDPPTIQEPEASDLYYGPNKRDFDTWNEREALRNTIREEWYDMEFGFWLSSPWSYTDYMLFINDFAKPFAEKDEVKCATLAEQLVRATVNWKNPDKYWDNFPQNEWDTETTYMHHCIGLLMMASIPIRRVEKRKDFLNTEVEYVMKPSKDAQASGMTEDFTMRLSTSKKRTMRVPASQFFDHLNHRGEVTDGFTQFDYLKNAFEVVKLVSTGTLSHLTWVRAFVQAHDALLADRQQIQRENGQWHTDCWATEWFFKVPPYTKFLGKMEDGRPREMRYSHEKETFEYVDGNP